MTAEGKPDAQTVRRVLEMIREPAAGVTSAMAEHAAQARKRNGHGEYGYRDVWQAGVDYLMRNVAEVVA